MRIRRIQIRTAVARTFCAPADSGNRTCGKAFTPNGPQAARSGEHRVVGVGKILPGNGFDALVRALPLIPAAEFVIIGEAERGDQQSDREARRLRGLAERLGVADRLRVHAHATDAEIPELLRSADVVACTPTYEPSGVVALEATACGVPVVACAVGTSRRRSTTCSVIPSYGAASVQGTEPSRRPLLVGPDRRGHRTPLREVDVGIGRRTDGRFLALRHLANQPRGAALQNCLPLGGCLGAACPTRPRGDGQPGFVTFDHPRIDV